MKFKDLTDGHIFKLADDRDNDRTEKGFVCGDDVEVIEVKKFTITRDECEGVFYDADGLTPAGTDAVNFMGVKIVSRAIAAQVLPAAIRCEECGGIAPYEPVGTFGEYTCLECDTTVYADDVAVERLNIETPNNWLLIRAIARHVEVDCEWCGSSGYSRRYTGEPCDECQGGGRLTLDASIAKWVVTQGHVAEMEVSF